MIINLKVTEDLWKMCLALLMLHFAFFRVTIFLKNLVLSYAFYLDYFQELTFKPLDTERKLNVHTEAAFGSVL